MNFKSISSSLLVVMAGAMMTACGDKEAAPLLKGHISGIDDKTEVYLIYSYDGDSQSNVYDKVELDSLGGFTFDTQLPEGTAFMEMQLMVGGNSYGAYVENGATTVMDVQVTDPEEYATVTFSGDNADVSEAVNAAAQAYDFMRYFSMDPATDKGYDYYSTLLDNEHARVNKALEGVSDSSKKEYYTKLYSLQYLGEKMRLLSNKYYTENGSGASVEDDPDYKSMLAQINVTDPMMVKATLTPLWINANEPYHMDWDNPDVDSLIVNLTFIDKNVTESANRRSALHAAPYMYLMKMKPTKADATKYMEAYRKVAADYPDMVEEYQKAVDGIVELTEGTPMPYYPVLTDTEGNEVKLKDLLGKVTYIDIWATWCGPCCREIPYLDKVVERFKGKDGIQFISISVDDDLDAWHSKLDKDNPAWPQYVLTGDERKNFMSAMGIQGIPRFILLDAEGHFIQNDAVRPSSDNIDAVLNGALK